MTRHSDGPKTYWGYYQDYLVQIYGKKIPKNIPSIFSKNHKAVVWRKPAKTEVAADFQIWSKNWIYVSSIITWCQYGQLLWPNLPVKWG